jgi:hypothetical protein
MFTEILSSEVTYMSFNELASFTQKVADAADQIVGNPVAAKAIFDAAPEELRTSFNNLVKALKSTTIDDSGAKNTGATSITGLTGSDVQSLIESLKTYTDGIKNGVVFGKGSVNLNGGFVIFTAGDWITEANSDTFQKIDSSNIKFLKQGLYKVDLSCTRSDLPANQYWEIGFSINNDAAKLFTEKMIMGQYGWNQSGGANLAQVPLYLSYFVRVNANDYINFNNNSSDGPRSYNMKFCVTRISD